MSRRIPVDTTREMETSDVSDCGEAFREDLPAPAYLVSMAVHGMPEFYELIVSCFF